MSLFFCVSLNFAFLAENTITTGVSAGSIFVFLQESSSFCRENEIFENKKGKKKKSLDQLLTYKKASLGPAFNFTAYIYIYGWRRPRRLPSKMPFFVDAVFLTE